MQKLFESLHEFGIDVKIEFENINRGGCCVFAAEVGKKLQKYFPVRVRVLGYGRRNLNKVRQNIIENQIWEWDSNGVELRHILLEFKYNGKRYFFDAGDGVREAKRSEDGMNVYAGHLTIEEADELAKQTDWNDTFDRSDIPYVKAMIKDFFKYCGKSTVVAKAC